MLPTQLHAAGGADGVRGTSVPAPDPPRLGTRPKKSHKKAQQGDRTHPNPAEPFPAGKGPPKSLGNNSISHYLSRGQRQAAIPSPHDIFGVSESLRGTKHPSQRGGCGSSAADKGPIQPRTPTPAPHPVQLLAGSAASPRQQPAPIMWLLMKSRSGQSDDIAVICAPTQTKHGQARCGRDHRLGMNQAPRASPLLPPDYSSSPAQNTWTECTFPEEIWIFPK